MLSGAAFVAPMSVKALRATRFWVVRNYSRTPRRDALCRSPIDRSERRDEGRLHVAGWRRRLRLLAARATCWLHATVQLLRGYFAQVIGTYLGHTHGRARVQLACPASVVVRVRGESRIEQTFPGRFGLYPPSVARKLAIRGCVGLSVSACFLFLARSGRRAKGSVLPEGGWRARSFEPCSSPGLT
jgi:hypothetical protein